jgi:hypothetical protein
MIPATQNYASISCEQCVRTDITALSDSGGQAACSMTAATGLVRSVAPSAASDFWPVHPVLLQNVSVANAACGFPGHDRPRDTWPVVRSGHQPEGPADEQRESAALTKVKKCEQDERSRQAEERANGSDCRIGVLGEEEFDGEMMHSREGRRQLPGRRSVGRSREGGKHPGSAGKAPSPEPVGATGSQPNGTVWRGPPRKHSTGAHSSAHPRPARHTWAAATGSPVATSSGQGRAAPLPGSGVEATGGSMATGLPRQLAGKNMFAQRMKQRLLGRGRVVAAIAGLHDIKSRVTGVFLWS